jgi:hypothetical protein
MSQEGAACFVMVVLADGLAVAVADAENGVIPVDTCETQRDYAMPPSGTDRLVGVRAKTERAKKHIGELDSAIDVFFQSNPYRVSREDDRQLGGIRYVLRDISTIPVEIPVIAGDVLHNLRSAMDHIVGQLVLANGGTIEKRHCFPVVEFAKDYQPLATRALKGVRQEAIDLVADTKPYEGGDDDLWHIHQMNNIDKHRLLLPAASYNQGLEVDVQGVRFLLPATRPLAFENGKTLLFVADVIKDSPTYCEPRPTFDMACAEPDKLRGEPIRETLRRFHRAVESLVDQFVPFL